MRLWNPYVSPGGLPHPAPVGSGSRASAVAGTWTLLAGLRLGAELETRRGSPLLRRRCPLSGCVVRALVPAVASSGGLGKAARPPRGGERSGRLGGEGREPRPVCTRGHPAGAPPCTSHFHPPPFTRPLAHSHPEHPLHTYAPAPAIPHSARTWGWGWGRRWAHRVGVDPISTCCLT